MFNLKGGKYDKNALKKELHDHAWFIAYAPYDNPKVVVATILENAGGGGANAAPVVRQVMDFALTHTLKNEGNLQSSPQNSPIVSPVPASSMPETTKENVNE